MADRFTYDVFLSHNSNDKPRVRKLAEDLRAAGLRVWFDEWVIKPGDDADLTTKQGLEAARAQVLCLSPAALGSEWVTLERSTVLFRDPTDAGRRFIPLLLTDCVLPDALRHYRYIDYRYSSDPGFEQLLTISRPGTELTTPAALTTRPEEQPGQPPEQAKSVAVLKKELSGTNGRVYCVAFSPDGRWVASGSEDAAVCVWQLEPQWRKTILKGHLRSIRSISITPDGGRILSASDDNSIRVWDVSSGQKLIRLMGHRNQVLSVAALQDNIRALSGGLDNTLRLWDLDSGECLKTIKIGEERPSSVPDDVFSVAVDLTGTRALSGHRDGRIRQWDLETGRCLATLKGHSHIVKSIQVTPNQKFAVSGSKDKTVKIWNLREGTCIGTLEGHQDSVESIAISSDSTLISSGSQDKTIRIWDLESGGCLQVIEQEKSGWWNEESIPISVAFSPLGSQLAAGYKDGKIKIYYTYSARSVPPTEITRRYVNAKVVLIGEGGVGKTSLAHRLIEDHYVISDRTHGMNVWLLDLPLLLDNTLQREALLWDLAGQEDYRLIHRLFLEETALALLLVNPQREDPFLEAGDWLKSLETSTERPIPRLLIFSQVDVGGMKISNTKIERFLKQHGFSGWLTTSAKTGENCSDMENGGQPSHLKRMITEHIPWSALPWTATPRLLGELKNAVMTMRNETDIRLLRFHELAQRLEQALPDEQFGEAEVRTAVTLLANHGLVQLLKFGDLVLLRPDLLNGYAGAIIRAARAHKDEIGSVSEEDIYGPDLDFTGVDRLRRPDEELLLRALVQTFLDHSMCIAEDTSYGRLMVFPSQYRREKDIPWEPDVFISYTFSGEWQTVWTTLVVRLWYSQEFEHKELWRNAAEFQSSKKHLLGLKIDNRQGEGQATISLFFDVETPDELKVIFIGYVHQHLARYGSEVTRDRRYVCPQCAQPVIDLEAVRRRLAVGKDFIYCQNCDAQVPLTDHIEQRLKTDPVARKIFLMEEVATRELDTQALEQILIGHMMAICGEANQIFRPVTIADYGIDGELEFRDDDGRASGKKIYVQLKSGNSYLRTRKRDDLEIFDVKDVRHLGYWINQPVDVYLVIRQKDERSSEETIRWMNVTGYLKDRKDKKSRQIVFEGERLDMQAVWRLRDRFFPPRRVTAR